MDSKPAVGGVAESAIIVPVQVPVAVSRLRDRMDPSAAEGVPAHVTLIYPFMAPSALNADVHAVVSEIVGSEPSFPVTLRSVVRWANLVFLAPEPDEPFRRMIQKLADAFPAFPPYGGAYPEVIPHVTIAREVPDDYLAAAEHALPAMLPIRDVVREAWLIGHTPQQIWRPLWTLPFGGPSRSPQPRG